MLAITLGDPAGIGTEVTLRALAELPDVPATLFGSAVLTHDTASRLGIAIPDHVALVDVIPDERIEPVRFGQIDARYGSIALRSIDLAVEAVRAGSCSALVTAPIHKQAVRLAGSSFPGHTEYLADKAGLKYYGREFLMYFDSPTLRVGLLSVHLPLRRAIELATEETIADAGRLLLRETSRLHRRPTRLAIAGVNPHAGEGGAFGDDEESFARAVAQLRREGHEVTGPHAADTLFRAAHEGRHDIVLAAYHDQGLIAVKTMHFTESVNVTLGLPWLRCSVDHGTAFDIAGKGVADHRPMRYAIEWAARHNQPAL